jgi:hypothetical protein
MMRSYTVQPPTLPKSFSRTLFCRSSPVIATAALNGTDRRTTAAASSMSTAGPDSKPKSIGRLVHAGFDSLQPPVERGELIKKIRGRVEMCRRLAGSTTDRRAADILRQMADEGEADIKPLLAESG